MNVGAAEIFLIDLQQKLFKNVYNDRKCVHEVMSLHSTATNFKDLIMEQGLLGGQTKQLDLRTKRFLAS